MGRRRSRPLRWTPLLAVVAVLLLASALPVASGRVVAGSPPVSASSPSLAVEALYSEPFAARAGFDGSYVHSVEGATPATGSELVVVTFKPSSPSFFSPLPLGAPPLTLSDIADQYGLAPSAYAAAVSYFVSNGLAVVHSNPDRLSLTVSGSPAQLDRAFGTDLEAGMFNGRAVTFPATAPSLPSGLEASVGSVVGLSTGFDTFALPAGLADGPLGAADSPAATSDLITPAIARQIYDLSPLYNVSTTPKYATGVGIVLLLWGWGYDPSDLNSFYTNNYPSGFPQPKVVPYPVDGAPAPSANAPNDPSKAPQELTLDLEWSGSMAPGATLDAVYAPDGPADQGYSPTDAAMTDALTTAVTKVPGVSVLSMSFGTLENESGALQTAWQTDLATASQEGITLLAATGDDGGDAETGCTGGPATDYPATNPDVIAVGGTNPVLARNLLGQVTGLQSESAWSGSGGGFSSIYPAPSWQEVGSAAAPISANGHRGVPDVSAAAAYNFLYYAGSDDYAAGTSFATPLWGGLIAEMDSLYGGRLGFLTPRLYAVGASQESGRDPVGLADITSGSTCIGTAGPGWDEETGWGSPRAVLLYEDLTATFVSLSISATPEPATPGGSVTITARLTNRTDDAPLTDVPVTLVLQSSVAYGPCAGTWGAGTFASNSSGYVSLSAAVPACYFGAHAAASATVTSDGYYGTNSTTVGVNLVGFLPALSGIDQFPANVIAFGLIMGVAIAIGYVLGRGRRRTEGSAPPPGVASPPATAPPPAPPPGLPGATAPSPPAAPAPLTENPPPPNP